MALNAISTHLRMRKQEISDRWVDSVRAHLPALQRLDRTSVVDHLPEFLEALASWIEGDKPAAQSGFEALAEGHAIQRLGYGIDLETLTREYALMRRDILRECLAVPTERGIREVLIRLNEGMDVAINEAVRRYTSQRDKARDRFIGILAHDLRNPLSSIQMAAARLLDVESIGQERLRRVANVVIRSADRMTRMINDVIEFARGHLGGGIPVQLGPCDMAELCHEAVDELRSAHPGRTIEVRTSGDLRGMWDQDRVVQTLSNLLGNAIQHGTDPVVVTATASDDRQWVITSVANQGPPIAKEDVDSLFDPFRKTQRSGGLGLGLYIVKQIVIAHGASIDVASNASGTTLTIRWPRTPLDEVAHR